MLGLLATWFRFPAVTARIFVRPLEHFLATPEGRAAADAWRAQVEGTESR